MALNVETGTGATNSESYLSVADTDTYNIAHENVDAWTNAGTGDKERALRNATQYLDTKYFARWVGTQGSKAQALNWPRSGAVNKNSFNIDSDEIPSELEDATAEMAIKAVAGSIFNIDLDDNGLKIREMKKIGPIEKETEFQSGVSQVKVYQKVDSIIRGIVKSSGFSVIRN